MWLREALGNNELRLVRMSKDYKRSVEDKYQRDNIPNAVSFVDGFPFLLISEASLKELNSLSSERIEMNRFRPNIVIEGGAPFVEDRVKTMRINNITLFCVKKCTRCKLTTVDQKLGEMRSNEPLNTLAKFRKGLQEGKQELCFGQNASHQGSGEIRVGHTIHVLEY
jgi:uncharacterized protein YcbX